MNGARRPEVAFVVRSERRPSSGGEAGPNILSTVAYWEVVLKTMKGLLEVDDLRTWWPDALEQLAATPLLLRPEHVAELQRLPPIHKDPFDRMLIAQAAVEGLPLLTTDREVKRYASERVRIGV